MTFGEADHRYAELKRHYDNGSLSDEEFDAQLKELMVQDDEDRWWAKSPETGEWHYYDGSDWVQGTPPGHVPRGDNPRVPLQSKASWAWLWIGSGIVCALLSLLLPLYFGSSLITMFFFGLLGIFFGYIAKRQGADIDGVTVMLASGVVMFLLIIVALL